MTTPIPWLPPIIEFDGSKDWNSYVDDLYKKFCSDFFCKNKPILNGLPIVIPKRNMVDGKHPIFWHIITEGKDEVDRLPTIHKASCIPWIRPVIENASDSLVLQTEQKDRKGITTLLWLKDTEFVVVLGKSKRVYVLITAYPTYRPRIKEKLEKAFGLKPLI